MKASKSNKFLIDGFPRKMDQALMFEKVVAPAKFVLYFECPEAEMLKRLMKRGETSGRVDDNIESIKKRFQTFRDTSYPVIEYYQEKGLVRQISCVDTVDKVYNKTKSIIVKEITH
jgi:UMP-CMP kinase